MSAAVPGFAAGIARVRIPHLHPVRRSRNALHGCHPNQPGRDADRAFAPQMHDSCINRDTASWPDGPRPRLRVPLSCGLPSAERSWSRAIPQVLITVVASNAARQICCLAVDDDGAAGLQHGAGPGDGLVRAAEPDGRVGGGDHRCPSPSRGGCGAVSFSTADHTDTECYAPLIWRVKESRPVDRWTTIGSLVKVRSARRWGWSASRVQHHGFPREQFCAARSPTPTSCAAAGPPRRARASPIDINIAPRRRPQAAVLADRFSYPTDEASNARPGLRSAEPVDHTGRAPADRPTQRCDGDLMVIKEYPAGESFPGVIGRTTDESSPAWPTQVRAAQGAPNVLTIVLDDTGFGQLGCYGSPIETPTFDAIAADGLRYNNMHTRALCSPSRSCIITGRNHHANGMAAITELASGFPGYDGVTPMANGFLSEILLENGYNTYMVGKWHLTPSNEETAVGPYDRWPLGRGFQRFYGFLGGDTSQWYPDLVYDNHQVEPPKTPEEGYHLSEDLVDKAVSFVADTKQADPDKPFYLHLCFGATHAPHHVAKEWADRYKGVFDDGWDAYREKTFARQKELGIAPADAQLSRHDPDVPEWDSLPAPARQLYARMMEVFAGFLSHTDHQVGRLLEFLTNQGELENTLIMFVSDNGASAEGGPTGTTNEAQFFNLSLI